MIYRLTDILISLGQNISLVIAILFLFSRFWPRASTRYTRFESAAFGLLFGGAACAGMLVPVEVSPGVFVDSRAVLVALAVLFGGPMAGIGAVTLPVLLRIWLGGVGATPGVGIIVTGAMLGGFIAWWLRNNPDQLGYRHLALLGILIAASSQLWSFLLPEDVRWTSISGAFLAVALLYPMTTVLLGMLLKYERQHRAMAFKLAREAGLFRQATTSAGVGVWELDYRSGNINFSEGIEELFGCPLDKVPTTYAQFLEFVVESDRDMIAEKASEALGSDAPQPAFFRTRWPDGSLHWYEVSGTVHRDDSGNTQLVSGVVSDVSARKEAEEALVKSEERIRESERLFRAMFDQAAVGVAQIESKTGAFKRINRRYCEIIGYPEEEILGRTFQKITHPDDVEAGLGKLAELVAGRVRTYSSEKRYLRKDGSLVWVNLSVSALWEPGDEPDSHVAIIEDITERKVAEIALRQSESRLQESQQIARIGCWEWNPATDEAWSSDILFTLLNQDRETYTPSLREFLEHIHPDDKEYADKHVRDAVATGEPIDFEFRIITGAGETACMMALGKPVFDDAGQLLQYHGVVQDISALRQSERETRTREERFRRLVESLPVCVHTLDLDGRLASINSSGLTMMGATSESEVCGIRYLDVASKSEQPQIAKLLERATAGEACEFDYRFEFEGTIRYFHSSFVPLFGEDGKVTEIMGHTVDNTADREREASLQQLVTAIDHAAESIIICDASGTIEYVNPAFEVMTGHSQSSVIGKHVTDVYQDTEGQSKCDAILTSVQLGETWKGEIVNTTRGGVQYREYTTLSPVRDDGGQVTHMVAVCRDITQERALESQLLQAQKLEAIGTLAGGIAHDFNNILHAMMGYCQMAREEGAENPSLLHSYLDEIKRGGERASQLVEQILTFSRASDADFKTLSLASQLKEIIRFLRGSLPASIDIRFEVVADPGMVCGNATQIHQLVTNLATNAYHAMERKGGALHIRLDEMTLDVERQVLAGTLQPGNYAVLEVADEGVGIPAEHLGRLVDPFFTTKSVGKGTGLGLSIVHGIASRMGGGIEIKSLVDEGTSIRVYLPAGIACERVESTIESTPRRRESGAHVLLVDDEKAITTMMGAMLKKKGYEVTSYNEPEAALVEFAGTNNGASLFDIVICDLTMPKMDGIELASRIHQRCPNIPIVLATGILEEDRLESLKQEGIQGVLRKPFSISALVDTIEQYL